MKIAYLSSSTVPSTAANSVHVMKFCAALARKGNDIDLYAVKGGNQKINDYDYYGVDCIFNIVKSYKPSFRGGGLIYRLISNIKMLFKKYDLIYARNYHHANSVLFLRIPVIIEVHDKPYNKNAFNVINRILDNKNFVALVAISNALKEEYLRLYPDLNCNKVIVAHDCADIPKKAKQKKSDVAIGYVGHLYKGKGFEIIAELIERMKDVKFFIVGGTKEDIENAKKACETLNVVFEGHIPNGELYKYYAKFDIVLAPYQKEVTVAGGGGDVSSYMSPLKLFEYMAYKKAIVCSDLPVLREVMKHEQNCLMCESDNIDSWENSIRKLIGDIELRKRLEGTAYADFIQNYTWDGRADKILEFAYRNIENEKR